MRINPESLLDRNLEPSQTVPMNEVVLHKRSLPTEMNTMPRTHEYVTKNSRIIQPLAIDGKHARRNNGHGLKTAQIHSFDEPEVELSMQEFWYWDSLAPSP